MVRCPELDLRIAQLPSVTRSGVLTRRGRHLHNWSKRHVVVASNFIFYYKSATDKPAGVVCLDGAKAATVPAVDGRRHCFEVVTRVNRVFTFQGHNRRDALMWVAAINAAAYSRQQERLQAATALYKLHAQRCGALAQQLQKWTERMVAFVSSGNRYVEGNRLRVAKGVAPVGDDAKGGGAGKPARGSGSAGAGHDNTNTSPHRGGSPASAQGARKSATGHATPPRGAGSDQAANGDEAVLRSPRSGARTRRPSFDLGDMAKERSVFDDEIHDHVAHQFHFNALREIVSNLMDLGLEPDAPGTVRKHSIPAAAAAATDTSGGQGAPNAFLWRSLPRSLPSHDARSRPDAAVPGTDGDASAGPPRHAADGAMVRRSPAPVDARTPAARPLPASVLSPASPDSPRPGDDAGLHNSRAPTVLALPAARAHASSQRARFISVTEHSDDSDAAAESDVSSNVKLFATMATPNFSYFKVPSPSPAGLAISGAVAGGRHRSSMSSSSGRSADSGRAALMQTVHRRQRLLNSQVSPAAGGGFWMSEDEDHTSDGISRKTSEVSATAAAGANTVDAMRAREFSFCAPNSASLSPDAPMPRTGTSGGGTSDGAPAIFGRGVASTSGDSRGGGIGSTSGDSSLSKPLMKHVPLTRGLPFTPDRPPATSPTPIPGSGASGPRSGRRRTLPSPAVDVGPRRSHTSGHARKRSASSGVLGDSSGSEVQRSALGIAGPTVDTGVRTPMGVDALRRRPLGAPTPPTPLNAAAGTSAQARELPVGVLPPRLPTPKAGTGAGAGGERSPASRVARVPAVAKLSQSDSPDSRERRNSMSASVKPVWELQRAHTSGSLDPESAMRQLSRSVTSTEVDELLLLGGVLNMDEGSSSDSGGDGRPVVLSDSSKDGDESSADGDEGTHDADDTTVGDAGVVVHGSVPSPESPPPRSTRPASPAPDGGVGVLHSSAASEAERGGTDGVTSDFGSPGSQARVDASAVAPPSPSPRVRLRGSQAEALTAMHRLLLARHASLLHAFLQGIPQRAKDVPVPLLRVFASHSPRAWLRVLRRAASAEVNSAATVASMFRTEGMGGKLLRVFALSCGAFFVHASLAARVAAMVDEQADLPACLLEVDPNRAKPTRFQTGQEVAAANANRLLSTAQQFMDGIIAGLPTLPPSFFFVCACLTRASVAKFHDTEHHDEGHGDLDSDAGHAGGDTHASSFPAPAAAAVGGFVFLRLIMPAILAPTAHGLVNAQPCANARRGLMLVAKLLQVVVSGGDCRHKEPFMAAVCRHFVAKNRQRLLQAFQALSTYPPPGTSSAAAVASCDADAADFCAGGPPLEEDLSTLLQVLALEPNLRALLGHLPETTAPAVRTAVERLARLSQSSAQAGAGGAGPALGPAGAGFAGMRTPERVLAAQTAVPSPSPTTKSRNRAMVTIGSLVGGGVRYAASSDRRRRRRSSRSRTPSAEGASGLADAATGARSSHASGEGDGRPAGSKSARTRRTSRKAALWKELGGLGL